MASPGDTRVASIVAPSEAHSSNEQLIASARHDVSRFAHALRTLGYIATLRTADGTLVSLTQTGCRAGAAEIGRTGYRAPVHDDRGEPIASLEVASCELGASGVEHKLLLRSLVDAAADSISERWFRMCHRPDWIFAAQCVADPEKVLLMALDRQQRVIAADWHARRQLTYRGLRFDASTSLLTFFQAPDGPIYGAQYCDVTLNLTGAADGAEWSALITAPHVSASSEARATLQAGPRVGRIGCVEALEQPAETSRGLPPRILRRVREYIETHLEETLGVDELAGVVGMSVTHFSRCFRGSLGLAPHGYVMRRRLLRAQALLAETDLELVEIALRTGFADQSHFSRLFRRLAGIAPSRFRRQHR